MNKPLTKSLATLLVPTISPPSGAQMFGRAADDDSLLGSMVPRAVSSQAPGSPGIVGSSGEAPGGALDRASGIERGASLKQSLITTAVDQKPADPSEFQKYVEGIAGGPVLCFGS